MYKIYLKQALQILRQNKLISIVSIAGTALAIMMIMVIILTEQIKNVSIAPEPNRDRALYLSELMRTDKENSWTITGGIVFSYYKSHIMQMEIPELTTAMVPMSAIVKREDSKEFLSASSYLVDADYWKLMSFDFLSGRPFNKEEDEAGMKCIVITNSVAKELFGTKEAVGETIEVGFIPYKIIGVVRDALPVFTYAKADAWIPYTSVDYYEEYMYKILLLAKNKKDFPSIKAELEEIARKASLLDEEWDFEYLGPYTHRENLAADDAIDEYNPLKHANRRMILLFAVLLVAPAVNLSSFSMSQIRKRTEEIGVRKAFGATKKEIVKQILYENLTPSLIGGVVGLIFSYLAVLLFKDWLLGVKEHHLGIGEVNGIPLETFLSPWIFLSVVLACVLLNLLSAAVPAYRASKLSIVDSLTQNEE